MKNYFLRAVQNDLIPTTYLKQSHEFMFFSLPVLFSLVFII